MTELEDIKGMRKILAERAINAGGYEGLSKELKGKFSASLIGMVAKGSRNVSSKLAKALGYQRIINYKRVK